KRDFILARLIATQTSRWPSQAIEDPIWGLIRIILAQQITTKIACRLAERVRTAHPTITTPFLSTAPAVSDLRALGVPEPRAVCCIKVLQSAEQIRDKIQ